MILPNVLFQAGRNPTTGGGSTLSAADPGALLPPAALSLKTHLAAQRTKNKKKMCKRCKKKKIPQIARVKNKNFNKKPKQKEGEYKVNSKGANNLESKKKTGANNHGSFPCKF